MSFELDLEASRAINVEGTRRVLQFGECCGARGGLRRFCHISTAYVAGDHSGCFSEDDLEVGQRFRNAYEQSKFEAERLVGRWRSRLPIAVLRPSIVVGERGSGWTTSFNVIYWPLRAFAHGAPTWRCPHGVMHRLTWFWSTGCRSSPARRVRGRDRRRRHWRLAERIGAVGAARAELGSRGQDT